MRQTRTIEGYKFEPVFLLGIKLYSSHINQLPIDPLPHFGDKQEEYMYTFQKISQDKGCEISIYMPHGGRVCSSSQKKMRP